MPGGETPNGPGTPAVNDWTKVTQGYERGDIRKEGAFIRLSRAGAVEAGTEATELIREIAESRGLTGQDWALDFWASPQTAQVACIPIPLEKATKASGLPRWSTGTGSQRVAWHIGGVFKEHRALRPKGDVKCLVTRGTGPDGLPALIIPVGANLSTQTQTQENPSAKTAAADDPK